ncbi:arylsulfatase [Flammeovirga pacifica]|uniref:Arylsulfatase n=1 Tax=Flammeovirga pacifica TaxID=915059 RepID=A0A1S1YS01_FLAPC|nr:arylsulfatase [Flammeovirga pacifica]OHX63808.1 arylsulfatase [Flammeovirga pacifica]
MKIVYIYILFTLFVITNTSHAQKIENSHPNIIFVMTDDQGMGDLSCMGNTILKTPHLDSFYAKSTRFTNFQVSPTCAPTRSALMSGRRPFEVGVSHTILQRERMALNVVTFPQALQKAGYTTGLFGKWHLGDEEAYLPQNRGFDEVLMHGAGGIGQEIYGDFPANSENTYFDNVLLHNNTIVKTKGFCTDIFFESALSWIKKQEESNEPYFCYLALNAPHGPFIAPEKYKKRFIEEGYDDKTAGRYGMIENIDDNFGVLMEKLNDWNALENTLVIFMTDNGMSMPKIKKDGKKISPFNAGMKGLKNTPWEGGTHVPAFWYWKGKLNEGEDISALTAHVDIYKTFCELAGADIPESKLPPKGRSLVTLLGNPKAKWDDREMFIHKGRWDDNWKNLKTREENKYIGASIRTNEWRLVFAEGEEKPHLSAITKDIGENINLASKYPEVVEKLKESYSKWWATLDPLLVNKNLPKVEPKDQPFNKRYYKQKEEKGIPEWAPDYQKEAQ